MLADFNKEILLLKLRLAAEVDGMTELSKKSGVAREHLYKILREGTNPNIETVIKIANALGMKVDLLPLQDSEKALAKPPEKSGAPKEPGETKP